jgi:KaiC/GvpD/RAD55 family RecA-like ATPase
MPRDRVRTEIPGLDAILLGGLPEGNITILTGARGPARPPWAWSSSIAGAHDFGEPGLTVTFDVSFFHALTSLMREHAVTVIYNFENPELLGLSSMMLR